MFGLVCCHDAGEEEPPLRVLGGARFRAVYVARGAGVRARLSARSAARRLAREGVRQALFPMGCAHRTEFARYGVAGISPVPLYRASAASLVRRALSELGVEPSRATVAFAAARTSAELSRAVTALAADVRYITLAVPCGGEELAHALRRAMGVAARLAAPGERPRADLTVCFDACEAEGAALPLWDASLAVEYEPPPGLDRIDAVPNELLAALWRAGALDAAALWVRRVETAT